MYGFDIASIKKYIQLNRCCVCNRNRLEVVNYHFPTNVKRHAKWITFLKRCGIIDFSPKKLSKLLICENHFERRFISNKSRLYIKAYLSLFTEEEIVSGKPSPEYIEREDPINIDHCYSKTRLHYDHSYCMDPEMATGTPEDSSVICNALNSLNPPVDNDLVTNVTQDNHLPALDYEQQMQEDECPPLLDLTIYEDGEPTTIEAMDYNKDDLHEGLKCNECDSEIRGFRYICVECTDWDMCGSCEARGAHRQHYVLRLPGPRPQNDVQNVLENIRRGLLDLNVFIDSRVKEENNDTELDPLLGDLGSFYLPELDEPSIVDEQLSQLSEDDEEIPSNVHKEKEVTRQNLSRKCASKVRRSPSVDSNRTSDSDASNDNNASAESSDDDYNASEGSSDSDNDTSEVSSDDSKWPRAAKIPKIRVTNCAQSNVGISEQNDIEVSEYIEVKTSQTNDNSKCNGNVVTTDSHAYRINQMYNLPQNSPCLQKFKQMPRVKRKML